MDSPQQPEAIQLKIENFRVKKVFFDISTIDNNKEEPIKLREVISYDVRVNIKEKRIIIIFSITFNIEDKEETFLQVEAEGIFKYREELSKEVLENNPIIKYNAPAILFPLLRSFIAVFTLNAGISPLYTGIVNFYELGENIKVKFEE